MVIGGKEDGGAVLELSKEDYKRLLAGKIVERRSGDARGDFVFTVKFERTRCIPPLPKNVAEAANNEKAIVNLIAEDQHGYWKCWLNLNTADRESRARLWDAIERHAPGDCDAYFGLRVYSFELSSDFTFAPALWIDDMKQQYPYLEFTLNGEIAPVLESAHL